MKKFILISLFLIMLLGTALYAQVDVTMGAGESSNGTSAAPTPYGTWYKSFRQQYLYTAYELNNAGGGAGNIYSLAFNVQNPNTCSAMPGFTIRIKETSQTALSGAFETGDYTTVFEQDGFQPVSGWNTHNFIAPFNWNGSSNILVDIYSNLVSGYTQNASVYYTPTTGVNTALRYHTDYDNAIDFTGTDTTASTYRANTRFNMMAFQATNPPNATSLIAPANGATFIPITGTTLSWNPASGAPTGYKVYLGTSPTIGTLVDVGTDLSYPTGALDPGTDYYWQVVPYNEKGDATVGDPWMFTTVPEGTILIGGGTATSRFPLGSYFGYERSAALYTATEIGAGNKRISEFGWYATLTHNAAVPTKIYLKTYPEDTLSSDTWANMINGATTVYDATHQGIDANDWLTIQLDRTFDLDSGNNLLVLVERNYGGSGNGTTNGAGIQATTISGMHYTWQADTNPPTVVGSIQSTRPNLLFMASSYEISGPPNPAVLLYPTDGEPNIPLDVELRWASGGGAPTGYKLYISENDPPDFYRDMGDDTICEPDFLEYEKTYYWQVVPYRDDLSADRDDCDVYSFTTSPNPVTLPFSEDFESWPNNWAVVNGTQINQWHVGTATHHNSTQSAYISNDGGATNSYNISSASVVHLYRDIAFTADSKKFDLEFWWKGYGEGSYTAYDYLRVYLVDPSVTPVAGTLLDSGQLATYNLEDDWTKENIELPGTLSGTTKRLVFTWRNDSGGGMQNPAAIDDILLTATPKPTTPIFAIDPEEYDFKRVQIDTEVQKVFTIKNVGVGYLEIAKDDISITGDDETEFDFIKPDHDLSIPEEGEAEITVIFKPKTKGLKEAVLNIIDNTGGGPHSIELEGEGVDNTIYPDLQAYTEGFDSVSTPNFPDGWTVLNPDNLTVTWKTETGYPLSAPNNAGIGYTGYSAGPLNDWLITPPVALSAGVEYRVGYNYKSKGSYIENLAFYWGTAPTAEAMTNELANHPSLGSSIYALEKIFFTPSVSGNYFFGWHAYSIANQLGIAIDDIEIMLAPTGPVFSIDPEEYDFKKVQIDTEAQKTFTIRNNGAGTLLIAKEDISISGTDEEEFDLIEIEYDIRLDAGEDEEITVIFAPKTKGLKEAFLNISDNTGSGRALHVIDLSGEGFDSRITDFPWEENFDAEDDIPAGWTVVNVDGGGSTWEVKTNAPNSGLYCVEHMYASGYQEGWLITPPIVVPEVSAGKLDFAWWTSCVYPGDVESNTLQINTTNDPNDNNWVELWNYDNPDTDWSDESVSLEAYAGQTVYIAFVYIGTFANTWRIDDLNIDYVYDYPDGDPVSIGADETQAIITITGGSANEVPGADLPPLPNQNTFTPYHSFVLDFIGLGPWTVTIVTDIPWLAYYYNGGWTALENQGSGFTYTISKAKNAKGGFQVPNTLGGGQDPTLPVELATFTATLTADFFVKIAWMAESETNHAGYNILRSEVDVLSTAVKLNSGLISEGEVSGTQLSYQYLDSEVLEDAKYYYWLESLSLNGETDYYGPLAVSILAGGEEQEIPVIPLETKLYSAFPNPFNPATNLRYSMKEAGDVSIQVFNIKGQLIQSFERSHEAPGYYQVSWNGRDQGGKAVTSGVYFYRMTSGKYSATKKMIMSK